MVPQLFLLLQLSSASFLRGQYPDYGAPAQPVPTVTCDVTGAAWGAAGDGVTDDTAAIQHCLDACGATGTRARAAVAAVLLPRGRSFVAGALNLTSRLLLRLEGTLLASTDPAAYPVVPALPGYGRCRDSGYPPARAYARHQALLSGWNLTDVWVDGGGVGAIDGRGNVSNAIDGTSWNSRFRAKQLDWGRPRLVEPMFGDAFALTRLAVRNQPFWAVHPYGMSGVYLTDLNITAPRDEGIDNDDGLDPDSCEEVLVERCVVDVGDNSVAVKSGMDGAGRAFGRPTRNVVFQDCEFVCETFAIGSEMSGGVYNLTVRRCAFGGRGSDFAGVHIKSARGRGGAVHGIVFEDVRFDMTASENAKQPFPISASLFYEGSPPPTNASATPEVYGVAVRNATIAMPAAVAKRRGLFQFVGLPESPLRAFHFEDVRVVSGSVGGQTGDDAWSCTDTAGFTFAGNITPAPGKQCRGEAQKPTRERDT